MEILCKKKKKQQNKTRNFVVVAFFLLFARETTQFPFKIDKWRILPMQKKKENKIKSHRIKNIFYNNLSMLNEI